MIAHGGIATLAVLFALAFAAFQLANALAQVGVVALQQHLIDPESGGSGLDFRIAGTDIELSGVGQRSGMSLEEIERPASRDRLRTLSEPIEIAALDDERGHSNG